MGDGKTDAAIQLEQCCNELAKTHEVDLLCAYPASGFHGEEDEHVFPEHLRGTFSCLFWVKK